MQAAENASHYIEGIFGATGGIPPLHGGSGSGGVQGPPGRSSVEDDLVRLFGGREALMTEDGSHGVGASMPTLKKIAKEAAALASRLSTDPKAAPFKSVKVNVVQREPGTERFVRRIDDPLLNVSRIDPRWLYQDVQTFRPLMRAPSVFIPDLSMVRLLGSMVPEIRAQFFNEAQGARRIVGPRQHMLNLCNSSVCTADVCDPDGCNPDICNIGICNTIVYSPHAYQRDYSEHGQQRAASPIPPGITGPFGSGVHGGPPHNHGPAATHALQLAPPPPPPPAQHGHHQNHGFHPSAAGVHTGVHPHASHRSSGNLQNLQRLSADLMNLLTPATGMYNAGVCNVNMYNSNAPQPPTSGGCRSELQAGRPPPVHGHPHASP